MCWFVYALKVRIKVSLLYGLKNDGFIILELFHIFNFLLDRVENV